MNKLNFDNIPDGIPLGFQPIGIPTNPFAMKINEDSEDDTEETQQFKISDYNDILKQVEEDLNVKNKRNENL